MSETELDAPDSASGGSDVLVAEGLTKRYPGVVALENVGLRLRRGEIHALLGENGAGKSTLIGILSGTTTADEGGFRVGGEAVRITHPRQAQDLGITTIHQEQALAPHLSVLENIFLGRELRRRGPLGRWWLDDAAMRRRALALGADFGLERRELSQPAAALGALKQHVVQILKALAFDARVVILDEPTSGLADHERVTLFEHMRLLRDRGVAILWVTHRLDELFGLADVITVLRDGRHVDTVEPADQTAQSLVRLMVGRSGGSDGNVAGAAAPRSGGWAGERTEVLRLENVSRPPVLRDVSLAVHRGEILGIAGIAGAGRTELARAVLGADRIRGGTISVRGRRTRIRSPRTAHRRGIALVPEERKTQAILGDFSISRNISIADLARTSRGRTLLSRRREREVADRYVRELDIRASSVQQKVSSLSGGNQQKVVLARCLFTEPSVLLVDEPTQGIDVAGKADVYRLIYDFVDAGGAAVVISSELPELTRVSDRIVVMREGRVVGELRGNARDADRSEDDELAEAVMALAAREVSA